jgi:putative phage-type endonuclease
MGRTRQGREGRSVTPVIHRGIEQGTPEWFALKAGQFSSSKAGVTMGGLDTKGLADYLQDLAWERVYGPVEGGFKSKAMERGNEVEPEARDWYAFERGVAVEQVALVDHATLPNVCWSPDGLVEPRRGIEAKSPLHKAWMAVKRSGDVPAEYRWQVRWAIWTGELDGLDFVAYHPRAGGLIVPCECSESEKQQMAERVALLEPKVQKWVDILNDKRAAA